MRSRGSPTLFFFKHVLPTQVPCNPMYISRSVCMLKKRKHTTTPKSHLDFLSDRIDSISWFWEIGHPDNPESSDP